MWPVESPSPLRGWWPVCPQEPIRSEDLEVDGVLIPVYFSDIPLAPEGLPDEDGGKTLYIVSSLVGLAAAGSGRADLLVPGTGPGDGAIRDGNGHIVAVTRFKHVAC